MHDRTEEQGQDADAGLTLDATLDAGAPLTAPAPSTAHPDDLGRLAEGHPPSVRERFERQAYDKLGVPKDEFDKLDPVIRNRLITRFYAGQYMQNPDDLKWAGMAAYGSQTVGEAMMESRLLDDVPIVPGAPEGQTIENVLASGNGGLFQQIGWQHMAFEEGGMDAMEQAFIDGDLPLDQLLAWQQIADGKALRDQAQQSGDEELLAHAEAMTWAGNSGLLHYEQNVFLQDRVYDGNDKTFDWLSATAPLRSPVPGGTSFQQSEGPDANLADPHARWSWVGGVMTREWQERDRDRTAVMADMEAMRHVPLPEGGAPDWYPSD